ncbi:hypothetical protein SSX86_029042 [Deinandra increscens subsp. villosa]|uniref:Uncharacterized protein n=1 Tax=Deinandra increscens subsp. villosa TaxID=3103831 RepID=A0AAP0CBV4_9ASTR
MQQQQKIDFAPSFSFYSSDGSITSTAIAKVIHEEQAARLFHENNEEVEYEEYPFEFEFSLVSIGEEETDSSGWTVFNQETDDIAREIKSTDDEIDASSATTTVPFGKLFIGEREESSSSSYSSSESESPRSTRSGLSSPSVTKCKKSSSTGSGSGSGSGSKRWIFRYLLRRSNSEGKQPKKAGSPKHKRISGEVSKTGGRWKAETPVHEQFYVQRRAENESGKRKSFLPYRKDLVGLVGMGKMLPF